MSLNILNSLGARRLGVATPRRTEKLAKLISECRPDVVALQEVDEDQIFPIRQILNAEAGLDLADYFTNTDLPAKDGCAIFLRPDLLELVPGGRHSFRLNTLVDKHLPNLRGEISDRTHLERALHRELREKRNLLSLVHARLRPGLTNAASAMATATAATSVFLGSGHLFWDPKFPDLKLLQSYLLAKEVSDISSKIPVVLGVDLNSLPDSAVSALLTSGKISASHPEHPAALRKTLHSDLMRGVRDDVLGDLEISYPLRSVMQTGEPEFTNSNPSGFRGCIDYALVSDAVRVRQARVLDTHGLSDHQAILAHLVLYIFCVLHILS